MTVATLQTCSIAAACRAARRPSVESGTTSPTFLLPIDGGTNRQLRHSALADSAGVTVGRSPGATLRDRRV